MKRTKITMFVALLSVAFLCLPACRQIEKLKNSSTQDLLIKSEVEIAVSMLQGNFWGRPLHLQFSNDVYYIMV